MWRREIASIIRKDSTDISSSIYSMTRRKITYSAIETVSLTEYPEDSYPIPALIYPCGYVLYKTVRIGLNYCVTWTSNLVTAYRSTTTRLIICLIGHLITTFYVTVWVTFNFFVHEDLLQHEEYFIIYYFSPFCWDSLLLEGNEHLQGKKCFYFLLSALTPIISETARTCPELRETCLLYELQGGMSVEMRDSVWSG